MSAGIIQNMAPNAKRSFVFTLVFAACAIATYFFLVDDASIALEKTEASLVKMKKKLDETNLAIKSGDALKARHAELSERVAAYETELLTQLLESYAMRAKTILDPLALGAGLTELDYSEVKPFRPLPIPPGNPPRQLHTRALVKMTAIGSYQSAISFIQRLELEKPLIAVQSLDVTAIPERNDEQAVTIILEWPAKGKLSRP